MTGLVLCGGKSSRMGSDKGLMNDSGITWAETACRKLARLVSPVRISVGHEQFASYAAYFPAQQLLIDDDTLTIGGPLRGLISAHIQMPEEAIFLLACDLLLIEPIVFHKLLALQKQSPDYDAFVFVQDAEAEPLCAIYTAKGLQKILAAYREGSLGKQSMKHILEMLHTLRTALPAEWKPYFKNINTRQDLHS